MILLQKLFFGGKFLISKRGWGVGIGGGGAIKGSDRQCMAVKMSMQHCGKTLKDLFDI